MEQETTDFWQTHSIAFLEMAFRSDRHEALEQPDGFGGKTGDCGDTISFYIKLDGDRLGRIAFTVQGCVNTNACANAIAELMEDRTLDDAWEITPERVAGYLETLPEDHFHCAELAVGAFYLALADCRETRRNLWKKPYR